MKLSKPKKKTIARILAVISVILFCYYYSTIKTPYSSVQKIVSNIRKTEHAEILDILAQKDVFQIFYQTQIPGNTTLHNRIVYKVGNKFYIDNYGSVLKQIFSETTFSYYIAVKKMNDKYIVTVMSLFIESPNPAFEVKDNIPSSFEITTLKTDKYSTVAYLVVLDTLPPNYIVTINGNQISIN